MHPMEEETPGPSGASRARSLPPPSSSTIPEASSAKKDKEKRFSLFTKKKWASKARERVATDTDTDIAPEYKVLSGQGVRALEYIIIFSGVWDDFSSLSIYILFLHYNDL